MEIDIIKEARNVFDIEIAELEKLKSKLGDTFQKLVQMILELKDNNKVIITGIGKSGIIGKKIAATLASTGTTAVFINAAEALHGDLGMVSNGDVVIAISNSGNSDEVLSILAPIRKIGGKIVAFTGNPNSTLGKYAELTVNVGVEKEACPLGQAPMSSTTATLVTGDALAACLMKLKDFTEKEQEMIKQGLTTSEISDKETAAKILDLVPQEWIKRIPFFVRKHATTRTIKRISVKHPELYAVAKRSSEIPEKEREELRQVITDIFQEKMNKHKIK